MKLNVGIVIVSFVGLVLLGCGSSGGDACGPGNCQGCCAAGVCQSGSLTTACGTAGATCNSCSSGLSCIAGSCQQGSGGCSPSNCTGCCLNNTCQAGNTAAGCGKNGASCGTCSANQICRTDQTCGVDPNSTWKVQPTAATITATNNGSTWDGDSSAPDVSVFLDCAPIGSTFDSQTPESQSYTPSWTTGGCTGKASDLLSAGFQFQVFDIDVAADDTITQNLSYVVKEADFVNGTVSFQPNGGMQTLSMQLSKQ